MPIAELTARFFEMLPTPLLTRDQLRLLKYDNVSSGKYKTNSDIGIPSVRFFDQEVKKYCYMWREGGQFSTEKYLANKDLKNNINNESLGGLYFFLDKFWHFFFIRNFLFFTFRLISI